MIVCPVCENPQQAGDTCDVCGKRLAFTPPTSEQYPPLPELEQTLLTDARLADPVQVMAELEIHRHGEVAVAPEILPDLQLTLVEGAGEARAISDVAGVADVEQTSHAGDGQRTVLPDTVTCRYCGHPQRRDGRLCERCANALPMIEKAEAIAPKGVICPSCKWESASASRACPACGFYLREA